MSAPRHKTPRSSRRCLATSDSSMDALERGALTLVRLIGVTFVVATILELGLYWAECSIPEHKAPLGLVPTLLRLIPAVLGFVILLKARAIAEWISNILDQ